SPADLPILRHVALDFRAVAVTDCSFIEAVNHRLIGAFLCRVAVRVEKARAHHKRAFLYSWVAHLSSVLTSFSYSLWVNVPMRRRRSRRSMARSAARSIAASVIAR